MDSALAFRIYSAESVGAAIRHYRTTAGLTQEQLAARVRINRTFLSEIENGKHLEQLNRTLRILKQLGVRMTFQEADW